MELPAPDLVIYLDMPTEITEKMMEGRRSKTGEKGDIHERDEEYLRRCRSCALEVADRWGWKVISCSEGDSPRGIEDIHRDIVGAVEAAIKSN